ncbi:hypothetical protein IJK16_02945 [Candidatus Saccharibacteria bacterium]|nr:hypothetical protein [Candidatus Saccharibacteria bacterium]
MKLKSSTKKGIIAAVVIAVLGLSVSLAVLFLSPKQFKLSPEYYGSSEQIELTNAEYDQLVEAKKSFVVFIDLGKRLICLPIVIQIDARIDCHRNDFPGLWILDENGTADRVVFHDGILDFFFTDLLDLAIDRQHDRSFVRHPSQLRGLFDTLHHGE